MPFHSLIICRDYNDLDTFSKHEVLSKKIIETDLVGNNQRFNASPIMFSELCHRLNLKLSIGERVAVYVGDLTQSEETQVHTIGTNQGATILKFNANARPSSEFYKIDWKGITVVGDVHGNKKALSDAIDWAKSRQHYIWLLGDIIDYGADSLETMNMVYHLVMKGHASMILGNHERKIAKWVDQKEKGNVYLRLSDGNKTTVRLIENLNPTDRKKWIGRYKALLAHAQSMAKFNNFILVHAAVHPSVWIKPDDSMIEQFSLYGESIQIGKSFTRTYNWIDAIPKDQTVIVGHDVINQYPMLKSGKAGGNVIFLDTGCGKGGFLSSADLKFDKGLNLRLECFKRY